MQSSFLVLLFLIAPVAELTILAHGLALNFCFSHFLTMPDFMTG